MCASLLCSTWKSDWITTTRLNVSCLDYKLHCSSKHMLKHCVSNIRWIYISNLHRLCDIMNLKSWKYHLSPILRALDIISIQIGEEISYESIDLMHLTSHDVILEGKQWSTLHALRRLRNFRSRLKRGILPVHKSAVFICWCRFQWYALVSIGGRTFWSVTTYEQGLLSLL